MTASIEGQPNGYLWPLRCVEWRPLRKGTLLGFAEVQFRSGVIIRDIGIHRAGDSTWASPPGKPKLDKGNHVILKPNGKPDYADIVRFANNSTRRRWSETVLRAVGDDFPEALLADDVGAAASGKRGR